ncbi:hypothetical protein QSI_0623 [Clostridioides difficile P28]|nr:hypothetical protein QSI_0623 [Clostridioides difficile P28]
MCVPLSMKYSIFLVSILMCCTVSLHIWEIGRIKAHSIVVN